MSLPEGVGESAVPSSSPTEEACYAPTTGLHVPSSLDYYEALYSFLKDSDFADSSRVGSVEVVPPLTNVFSPIQTDSELALLRIVALFSFTAAGALVDGKGDFAFGSTAGLLLAVHHFNNGNGAVVDELSGLNETCPIRFVVDNFYDTESSQITAVDIFGRQIIDSPNRPPSALIGAWRSAVSVPLAILSGTYGIPQISPLSTSTELDDTTQYRYFSRLIPSDAGTARAVVDYFRARMDLRYLGVIYVNDSYGSAFNAAIRDAAANLPEEERMTVKGFPFHYNNAVKGDTSEIELAVRQLAGSKFRVFFGVFYGEHYDILMNYAYQYGIVGEGFVWIMSDGLNETFLDGRRFVAGSPLAIASQGLGILKAEGGRETVEGNTGFDRFAKVWYEQGGDAVSYYECKQPAFDDPSISYQPNPDGFKERELHPTAAAVFAYDSIVAMGLAACELASEHGSDYFQGEELFNAFVSQSFEGVTGRIEVDGASTSRDPSSAFFVLYNSDGTTQDGETTFKVETVAHSIRNPDLQSSSVAWINMEGKAFVYSDGTLEHPPTLPAVEGEDLNHLSPAIRGVGLALAGIILFSSIFFACWTYWFRNVRIVKASQPIFLRMICLGTLIMGCTIITLSIDDGIASDHACDVACMLSPWFMTYGFVIAFSALFSKTWRINKIFHNPQLRRIKVTTRDVILPFIIMLFLNTVVLTVWTIVSPLEWKRIVRGEPDDFDRPLDSYGLCTGDDQDYVPYVVLLLVINLSVLILVNVQAYQARAIATEFSESKYVAIIMASILQACCIGLPLFVLVADEPPASFMVRAGLIFVVCMSMLLLIFIPKWGYMKTYLRKETEKKRLKREREETYHQAMKEASRRGWHTDARATTDDTGGLHESNASPVHSCADDSSDVGHKEITDTSGADGGKAENAVGGKEYVEEVAAKEPEIRFLWPERAPAHNRSNSISSNVSCHDGSDGIKIMAHPLANNSEVTRLKAQVEYMKEKDLENSDKIRSLQELLEQKGYDCVPLLNSLTLAHKPQVDRRRASCSSIESFSENKKLPSAERTSRQVRSLVSHRNFKSMLFGRSNPSLISSDGNGPACDDQEDDDVEDLKPVTEEPAPYAAHTLRQEEWGTVNDSEATPSETK